MKKLIPYNEETPEIYEVPAEPIDLDKWAKATKKMIDEEDPEEERRRHKKWAKNRAFYRGNQRGFWDSSKRTWVSIDVDTLSPSEASILVVNNQFRPQVKTLAKEFSRSQARIRATAISDSQDAVHASRFADSLVKFYQGRLLTESDRQVEAKFLFLCGNSFRYTIYDKNEKGVPVRVNELTKGYFPAYEASICVDCGYDGTDLEEREDECPECGGSMETTSVQAEETAAARARTVNSGDIKTEIVDPVEIKVWAGSKCGLKGTPYLRRKRLVRKEFLKQAYPWYVPSKRNNKSNSPSSETLMNFMDTSRSTAESSRPAELHEYDQIWLDPTLYASTVLEKPIKLLTGGEIPAGTKTADAFKNGLYVVICDDNDVLGYADEGMLDCWVHIPYDINVDGFWADGLEDAVMSQQIINEYNSLSVENVLFNASPKLIINPTLMNPANMTGRPKDALLMSDRAKTDTDPHMAVKQLGGMSLTPDVAIGIDSSKRDMREQTGALVGFNGQGDPTLNTATSISIARDSALALVSTPLAIRAEKDLEWAWQILRYVKKFWYDEKYRFLLGKYSDEEAKSFKSTKLDHNISLGIESNSWMPTTQYEKLQNLGAFLTAFGIPMGFLNPQIPQVVRDYASQLYNVPFEFNELAPDIRIAQRRLDKGKAAAEEAISKAMLSVGVASASIPPDQLIEALVVAENEAMITIANAMDMEEDLDEHEVFIGVYTSWLKSDEGQTAHTILREAVKRVIAAHREYINQVARQTLSEYRGMTQNGGISQPKGSGGQAPFQPEEVADSPFNVDKGGRKGGLA